jgi:hypothetical protein
MFPARNTCFKGSHFEFVEMFRSMWLHALPEMLFSMCLALTDVAECMYTLRRTILFFEHAPSSPNFYPPPNSAVTCQMLFDGIDEDPQFCSWHVPKPELMEQLMLCVMYSVTRCAPHKVLKLPTARLLDRDRWSFVWYWNWAAIWQVPNNNVNEWRALCHSLFLPAERHCTRVYFCCVGIYLIELACDMVRCMDMNSVFLEVAIACLCIRMCPVLHIFSEF